MSTSVKDNKQAEGKESSPQAGRIVHDSRGNAVWKWDSGSESDPSSTATTSKMLRKLDLGSLSVEGAAAPESASAESKAAAEDANAKKKGSGYGPGYNPYDRTAPVRRAPPRK